MARRIVRRWALCLQYRQHRHLLTRRLCCAGTSDVEEGAFTRTAPEGIAVLVKEEVLPNSTTFTACWDLAEKMEEWPADKKSPSTETQVRTLRGAAMN